MSGEHAKAVIDGDGGHRGQGGAGPMHEKLLPKQVTEEDRTHRTQRRGARIETKRSPDQSVCLRAGEEASRGGVGATKAGDGACMRAFARDTDSRCDLRQPRAPSSRQVGPY